MQERTFVKGLIFANPALYIEQFSSLGEPFIAKARSHPKKEFIIFFLGHYGQSVFAEFGQLRKRYPIWVRRGDITMDVYSEEGFILVSDAQDPVELLAESCNCDFACFIMDSLESGCVALAEIISRRLQQCTDPARIGFAKNATDLEKALFHLTVEPVFAGQDLCAHLLITLYNNYLGERGFQDLFTSKSFYGDMLKQRHWLAQGGVAIHRGKLCELFIQVLVTEANRSIQELILVTKGLYLIFLETPPSHENVIMSIACRIGRTLHEWTKGRKGGNGNITVCNCAHPQDEIKLTLFYLYEKG